MVSKCLKLGLLLVGVLALCVVPAHAVPYAATDYSLVVATQGLSIVAPLTSCYDRNPAHTVPVPDPTCSDVGGGGIQGKTVTNVYFNGTVYTYVYEVTPSVFNQNAGGLFSGTNIINGVPRPLGVLEDSDASTPGSEPVLPDAAASFLKAHVDDAAGGSGGGAADGTENRAGLGWSFAEETGIGGPVPDSTVSLRGASDLVGQNAIFQGWFDPAIADPFFGFVAGIHWDAVGGASSNQFTWWDNGEKVTFFYQTPFGNPVLNGLNFKYADNGNVNGATEILTPGPQASIPEPGTLVLMATGLGLLGLVGARSRGKKVA